MAYRENRDLDALLYQALEPEQIDSQELIRQNNLFKVQLRKKEQSRALSLCYLPGIFHAVVLFLMAAAVCLMIRLPLVQAGTLLIAAAGSLAGGVLTRVGIRYFDLRRRMTIHLPKIR